VNPIQRFEGNVGEVKRILEIHREIAGKAPGRKRDVEVLNKSAVVLLVACWEAFIEDLAEAAFDFLLANAKTHNELVQWNRTPHEATLVADEEVSWKSDVVVDIRKSSRLTR